MLSIDAICISARHLGFATCGVTPIPAATPGAAQLDTWLSAGFHGAMAWMARNADRRADPRRILAAARSIISVTLNYYTPHAQTDDPLHGRISRYAWGDDYHDVMLPRLRQLLAWIQTQDASAEGVAYVDTGPVLEKPWAAHAGLGWQGKHTNLIDPQRGSWCFLGEILTTVAIEPSPAPRRRATCGTCTRCLDVCPTRAIVAPYQLDARRCISYLTIEHPGAIPLELRPLLGNHIYGCDLCQAVCPWNRFATLSPEPAFQPRPGTINPSLLDLMTLDDDGFRTRFRDSPIRRIKRRRLLRNVAVALGNSRDPRALPALERACHDPEPLIREHAAWAIGQITTQPAAVPCTQLTNVNA